MSSSLFPFSSSSEFQQQRRAETAIDWLLRLTEHPQDDELLTQWLTWCTADSANLEEFRRSCDLWNAFDNPDLQQLLRSMPPVLDKALLPTRASSPSAPAVRVRRRWVGMRVRQALAASAVLVMMGGVTFLARDQWGSRHRVLHVTELAQHSSDTLEDGSRIDIGGGSRVVTHYSEKAREVDLEKGEAFFEVAKDPERPFVVRTGTLSARALGTAFNVRTGIERTVVTVSHGLVEVQSQRWFDLDAAADARRAVVGPGEQVIYDKASGRLRVEPVDAEVATSWRQGRQTFRFVNEPLAEVIAYVNRYTERKIIVRDQRLGRRTFTGTVHHDRGDDWLLALERAYPLQVSRLPDGRTIELLPASADVAERR